MVRRTESQFLLRSSEEHGRLAGTLGIRETGPRLPILAIWRVLGQSHSCCSSLGIYLLFPPWYHKTFDLITYVFTCGLLFFLEDSKHHFMHLTQHSSAFLLAHYLNSFPRESWCPLSLSLSPKRTLAPDNPLNWFLFFLMDYGSIFYSPPCIPPHPLFWLKKKISLSRHLGAKTIGKLSRMRAFAAHSFLRGGPSGKDVAHGCRVGWTPDLVVA